MTVADSRREEILAWLDEVKDPEVPVLSIRELGVLRDVECGAEAVVLLGGRDDADLFGLPGHARDGGGRRGHARAPWGA